MKDTKTQTRKDILDFLARDRCVDANFIARLKAAGFRISYGPFSHWDNQPHVEIGDAKISLVTTYRPSDNSQAVCYRKRNSVVEDIKAAVVEQLKTLTKEDVNVEAFFAEQENQ